MFICQKQWIIQSKPPKTKNHNWKDQLLFILSSPPFANAANAAEANFPSPSHTYDTIYPPLKKNYTLPSPTKSTKLYELRKKSKHDLCTADWYYYLVSPFHSLLLDNWIKTKILQRKQFESVQYFWRLDLKTYVNSIDTLFWFRNMFELIGT